jgi:hypothetical protein
MPSKSQLCLSAKFSKYLMVGSICVSSVGFFGCVAQPRPQAQTPEAVQLLCADPQGYYPQVMTCSGGWQHEKVSAQRGEASPPLLVIPVPPPIPEGLPR